MHIVSFPTAKVLIFSEATENTTNFDGLTPVFLDVFRSSDITLSAFFAFRFVASLPFSAYATSANALNAATLAALTRVPRKARREPSVTYEFEEPKKRAPRKKADDAPKAAKAAGTKKAAATAKAAGTKKASAAKTAGTKKAAAGTKKAAKAE